MKEAQESNVLHRLGAAGRVSLRGRSGFTHSNSPLLSENIVLEYVMRPAGIEPATCGFESPAEHTGTLENRMDIDEANGN